jgi:benzoate-CoA ligase family protein
MTFGYSDVPRRFNLARHFLDRNLEEGRGDRIALYAPDGAHTYAEVAALANRIGHVLREHGVEKGDRVLLALADGVEFVAAWYAVIRVGGVCAEAYTFLQPKDYAYYINYTGARVVITDAATLDAIRTAAGDCPGLRHVLLAGDMGGTGQQGAATNRSVQEHHLSALVRQAPDELSGADTSRDDIALLKFTTGSTGAPKAAVHAQYHPLINYHAYALGVLGLGRDDVVLPVPKLFFGYARDLTALYPFGVGAAGIVFPDRSTPDRIFALIARHRPTILVQVPTMLQAMAGHPNAASHDLSCLRLCSSAGEALPAEIYHAWTRTFGVEVLDGIGSSELYHIYISNRPGRVRPGSVGLLVPGYQARVTDPDGRPLAPDAAGELWVRGESAALMYWNEPEKSRETFHDKWVRTGDLFKQDPDGYFWYQGRADDLLKVGGIWVAPLEIEHCLLDHPAVVECAVTGYEQDGLVLPRAYVVVRERSGSPDLAGELQAFVRARLSPHKYPRDVRFIERVPRTPSGKIDRKALTR